MKSSPVTIIEIQVLVKDSEMGSGITDEKQTTLKSKYLSMCVCIYVCMVIVCRPVCLILISFMWEKEGFCNLNECSNHQDMGSILHKVENRIKLDNTYKLEQNQKTTLGGITKLSTNS
jgi:hypothetical protein